MPGQTQDDLRVLHWRARTVVTRIAQAVLIGLLAVIATGDWLAAPWVAAATVTILLDAQIARRQLAAGGGFSALFCAALALSAVVYASIGLVLVKSGGPIGVAEAALVNCAVMLNATLMSRGVRRATLILTTPPSVLLLCLPFVARAMGQPIAVRDAVPMMVGAFSYGIFVLLMAKTFLAESQAMEAALAAKEKDRQWLRQGIEAMTEGVALFDAADRLLIWNHTFEILAPRAGPLPVNGIHAQDLLGAMTGGEDLATQWHAGGPMKTQLQTVAGRWLNIEFRPMANQGRMVVAADITDLKAREMSFRILFDDNPLPMLVIDRDSLQIVDVNAAAVRAFGWPREAMLALAVTEFLDPDGRDRAAEQLAEIVAPNTPAPMRLVDGFGRAREIMPYVQPTMYQDRPALLAAVLDVTERRQAMQAMEAARDAAEAANRAKSDFLATVSHEIRTPLNGVLGMAQAMARDSLPAQQRDRLEVISQSGETLLAILNDILDLSKIEAGKLELESAEFDLAELALGAHGAFTGAANGKGVSFNLEIAEAARGVYRGDSVRVRQVLYNLISNAVKFTDEGEVRVLIDRVDGAIRCQVRDTGPGVPADRLDTLFDKFVQADSSTTRRYGGTGLGLAITAELAKAMGGEVSVTSQVGVGSIFTARLPLERVGGASERLRTAEAPAGDPIVQGPPIRILAAEDNPVNQMVLKTLLAQLGLWPTIVDNGAAAVEAWAAEPWDLILMDVQMPVMDGPTAAAIIRAREAAEGRARTPILALTANAMTHQLDAYLVAGMDGVVAKPINIAELFAAISMAVEAAPDRDAAAEAAAGRQAGSA